MDLPSAFSGICTFLHVMSVLQRPRALWTRLRVPPGKQSPHQVVSWREFTVKVGRAEGTMRQCREDQQEETAALSWGARGPKGVVVGVVRAAQQEQAPAGAGTTEGAAFQEQAEPQRTRCQRHPSVPRGRGRGDALASPCLPVSPRASRWPHYPEAEGT